MERGFFTLLQLVKSALLEESAQIPETTLTEQIYDLAVRHQVEALVYDGAIRNGFDRKSEHMGKLFQYYGKAMMKSEAQTACLKELYRCFDEAGIDYMPLKGCIMKQLYPKAELRAMNDADILIRVEQYEKIKPILQSMGFKFMAESDCELKWVCRMLYLELHKRLIPSFIKDFYAYFGDGWQLATERCGTRYAMSKEDEFLFLFTHFARHYREGGVGIRHMADIWFYRRKYPNMDEEKIVSALKKMSLERFYENILKTLDNWFEGGEETIVTEKITRYITESGSLGSEESKTVAQGAGRGSKGKNVARLLFPPLGDMCYAYPVLQKHPVLLPAMWGYRWIKVLTVERNKIKIQSERLKTMETQKMQAFEADMRAVGIGFDFEEH